MYLIKIINTNGMIVRKYTKTVSPGPKKSSNANKKRNVPIGGIKDKHCSINNNLFNKFFPYFSGCLLWYQE